MMEIIQFYRSSGSGLALRCAVMASLLLMSGVVNGQQAPYSLTAGQPVAREMRGGEEHSYQLTLSAGQYARVVLDQKGIDVVLALLATDGKPLLQIDNN